MGQRVEYVEKTILVKLQVRVTLKSLSNHRGFGDGQVSQAIEEFNDNIADELLSKLEKDYYGEEILDTVDFVSYSVRKDK